MYTEVEIRQKLGEDYLANLHDENITYSLQRLVERFITQELGNKLPFMCVLTDNNQDGDVIEQDESSCDMDYDTFSDSHPFFDEVDQEEFKDKLARIDLNKTLANIVKVYPECVVLDLKSTRQLLSCLIFHDEFVYYNCTFYLNQPNFPQKMLDCRVYKEEKPRIRYVLRDTRGYIDTHYMDIAPKGGFEENYNDSLYPVHEKIVDAIHDESSSLIILHGVPGTGKTSYIRHLISENPDIKFYWLDSSLFSYIDTSTFVEFLVSCKNAVFILEDSESLLKSRDEAHNPAMQSLLSISDGMLGDSLKLKFICTFNTDLQAIDKALFRKGRMKVMYEFKPLAKDKVAKLFIKQGLDPEKAEAMPLCDVYNATTDNGNEDITNKESIGFN